MADEIQPVNSPSKLPWLQLFILMGGTFMAFLDTSIVSVAIPKMMSIFGVGIDTIQWITTGYLLSAGVTIPITGYFGDRLGLKNIFLISISIFTLGSAMCGLAQSETFLVIARIVQAVGGGAIMPVSTAYTYQIVSKDKIGAALGIRGIAMAMAPAFGPALGGYLVDHYDWHIIFTINLPVGILTLLLGLMVLPRIPHHSRAPLDFPGLVLITASSFCILLALSRGQSVGWGTLFIVSSLLIGIFSLILFVMWELSVENPIIDLRLFKGNPVLGASFLGTSVVTIALNASLFLIPIFVQQILGFTPYRTGLLMLPGAIVMGVLTPFTGRLFDKIGAVPLCILGIPISAFTTYELGKISLYTTFHGLQFWLAVRSIGFALFMLPITIVGLNTVPREKMNRVTALNSLVRQISGSLGIAYFTYVLDRQEIVYNSMYSDTLTKNSVAANSFLSGIQSLAFRHSMFGAYLSRLYSEAMLKYMVTILSNVRAIDYTMTLSAAVILGVIPLLYFLRRKNATSQ